MHTPVNNIIEHWVYHFKKELRLIINFYQNSFNSWSTECAFCANEALQKLNTLNISSIKHWNKWKSKLFEYFEFLIIRKELSLFSVPDIKINLVIRKAVILNLTSEEASPETKMSTVPLGGRGYFCRSKIQKPCYKQKGQTKICHKSRSFIDSLSI